MPLIKVDFFSEVLSLSTSVTVLLPKQPFEEGKKRANNKFPTLFLLHGFSDDHSAWTRMTSIERYVEQQGLAVVMPQVDHSFYTDMVYGKKYWTFLTEELPFIMRSMFPLSDKREDNFVAGLSMGGYGAFKWALSHPEQFAAAASLSGAVDIVDRVKNGDSQTFRNIFGEEDLKGTADDLFYLIEQGNQSNNEKPLLFQCCGTEDFLYEDNVRFYEFCKKTSYPLTTEFDKGTHEWGYWDQKIQQVLAWLPLHEKKNN
ncbi:esterase family protein [Caldibacillus lycopersici]|uniref:Esterase family protein n=1 Tax=Perspicuibacillus lycopersici TaxID=1325689 RepID=A0AAE3IS21_9BACI|nr:alpha/beta hydrolase family protein [Perspicuibacillus lycopersici]MCU9612366.1 esterase family protein [Perspicuibacillus lycopersici]